MLGSKISIRFLPLRLAMYMAMSAFRTSVSASWPSNGYRLTPILAVMNSS